ncbi:hypothetical protein BC829DRAFT_120281 [Chytridium lagenaria]|nr:hypothetical protein BC829DRAFT_120281 [Chytridium lagenaria]
MGRTDSPYLCASKLSAPSSSTSSADTLIEAPPPAPVAVVVYDRLQFKSSTNPKASDRRDGIFNQLQVSLMVTLSDGTTAELCQLHSSRITVRSKSPSYYERDT